MVHVISSSKSISALLVSCVIALSGCSDFKQAIGTEKSSPDEFEVVIRPPLSLPPEFGIRPKAENLGQSAAATAAPSQASKLLLVRSGKASKFSDVFAFDEIEEDIRRKVDEETAGVIYERRLPIQIIFGGLPDVGPVVDKMAEDARIRKNRLQQKVMTDGPTPAIDEVLNTPVLVK